MSKILIEVSARHVHLSQEHLEKLFGRGYELKPLKELSQKGQFAAEENLTLQTKQAEIEKVRILGPVREQTQVELSATDAYILRIKPPLRLSGDIKDSPGIKIIGPKGEVSLEQGVILAKRHIHADHSDAKKFSVSDGQEVSVKVAGRREVTFHKVVVRVHDEYVWRMHVDTDEGNAAGVVRTMRGEVI
ncbi:phosphate propanoyltransferase [Patescibacteria group bacterium]|nr:phosphate propanoyltransferase [Patescibacteria group bacterium]MBU4512150.1 phosphate propanoyltransferase [Patescibacteria group bacterium]MCG2693047.1 phosphate propanoyltransferase [Candidatus Parcubacteria bacterium]